METKVDSVEAAAIYSRERDAREDDLRRDEAGSAESCLTSFNEAKDVLILQDGSIGWSESPEEFQRLVLKLWGELFAANSNLRDGGEHHLRQLTATERPSLAHAVVSAWRDQSGRFLKARKADQAERIASNDWRSMSDSWADVTNQRATRTKLSKLLKRLGDTESSNYSSSRICSEGSTSGATSGSGDGHLLLHRGSSDSTSATMSSLGSGSPARDTTHSSPSETIESSRRSVSTSVNYDRAGRLYGREREQAKLMHLYRSMRSGSSRADRIAKTEGSSAQGVANSSGTSIVPLVLVSGESGVGKSALARSLRPAVLQDGGFFMRGKFEVQASDAEQMNAFISALTDLAVQLRARDDVTKARIRRRVIDAVGDEIRLLIKMVPLLSETLDQKEFQADAERYRKSSAGYRPDQGGSRRLEWVACSFLQCVASQEHPLVVLLDDIQWAKPLAVNFLETVMSNVTLGQQSMFLVTSRSARNAKGRRQFDDMVSSLSARQKLLEFHSIELKNLKLDDVQDVLSDVLSTEQRHLAALTHSLYSISHGNIFFLLELMRSLQEEDLLRFNDETGQWECDSHLLAVALEANTLVELFQARVSNFALEVQETLKVASCLGSKFDASFVEKILSRDVNADCLAAAYGGLLIPCKEVIGIYAFAHDSVQEAAYALIPPDRKEPFHFRIGRLLWKKLGAESPDEHMFAVLGQIFRGESQVVDAKLREAVASLCLMAGEKAAHSTGFHAAAMFLEKGIHFLGPWKWRRECYDLTLRLLNAAAEALYCIGHFDAVEDLVTELCARARFEESLQARATMIFSLTTQHRWDEAVIRGIETLQGVGERIPANPSMLQVCLVMRKTTRMLRCRTDAALLRLQPLTDTSKLAALHILHVLFLGAYYHRPLLSVLISCRIVTITIESGMSNISSFGFASLGVVLCGGGMRTEEGYRCGKLALEMCSATSPGKADVWLCRASAGWYGCIRHWRKPLQSSLDRLKDAYKQALAAGDMEYAALNGCLYIWSSLESFPLPVLERESRALHHRMESSFQANSIVFLLPMWQAVVNLQGRGVGENPMLMHGPVLDMRTESTKAKLLQYPTLESNVHINCMILAYFFGCFEKAVDHSQHCIAKQKRYAAAVAAQILLYRSLAILACCESGRGWRRMLCVRQNIKIIRRWATLSPSSFLGKQFLLEAEHARVTRDHDTAKASFHCAIVHSREGGFLMQEAIANELAGKYHAARMQDEVASSYFREALSLYKKWGGSAKIEHLKMEIKQLAVKNKSTRFDFVDAEET